MHLLYLKFEPAFFLIWQLFKLKTNYKMSKSERGTRKERANEIPWSELNFKRSIEMD